MKQTMSVLAVLLSGISGAAFADPVVFDIADKDVYQDSDWNMDFYDNAGLPVVTGDDPSVAWKEDPDGNRYLQFHLAPGDQGLSKSDSRSRSRAPFWERAEVKQTEAMERGKDYSNSMQFRFVEGFEGGRETFMQIHGYNKPCNAKPAVMFHMDDGQMQVRLRRETLDGHDSVIEKDVYTDTLLKGWNTMSMDVSLNADHPSIRIALNGEEIVPSSPLFMEECAALHYKFGIYRPGGDENQSTSRIDYDKIIIREQ